MIECFYFENLSFGITEIKLTDEEFRHFKALRVPKGDKICLVNGKGLAAFAYVSYVNNSFCVAKIINFVENLGEIEQRIDLALGILDNRERFEFAFEKAVELRISEFFPIVTKFSQRKKIDESRLNRKAISAIKQTLRSRLPIINSPVELKSLIDRFKDYDKVYVLDISGNRFSPVEHFQSVLLVIGPEGGLSENELQMLSRRRNVEIVRISEFNLRAETAVISALSIISNSLRNL
ncbi:MAG: RsmE family RNA methyltransferase [Candidatus Kapaibacteriota bacterium]